MRSLLKEALSLFLVTSLICAFVAIGLGIAVGIGAIVWFACSRIFNPTVGAIVGSTIGTAAALPLFGTGFGIGVELAFRVGRNYGRTGRVFDLGDE